MIITLLEVKSSKMNINMSWKTICNHKEIGKEETINNNEQPESPKVKKPSYQ